MGETMRLQRGFTIIELMITLAVMAILVSVAAPGYQDFVATTRLNSHTSELVTALHYARSEAIKRNKMITLCKSSDGASCAVTGSWAQGWIVFTDGGTTGLVDGTDTILRVHEALTGGTTLVGQAALASAITYRSNGTSTQSGQIDMCSARQTINGRDIIVTSGTGKPVTVVDALPLTCNGEVIP